MPPPTLGLKVMPYLRSVLPESYNLSKFMQCKEAPLLMQQPVKRHTTETWIRRVTALKVDAPRCLLALLLFLTGTPAENACPSCATCDSADECIIAGPPLPPFVVECFKGSCAACFYRCSRWHQKNQCLLQTSGDSTPPNRGQSPSCMDDTMDLEFADSVTDDGALDEDIPASKEPGPADGSSVALIQKQPLTLRSPPRKPHMTLQASDEEAGPAPSPLLHQGNHMSADVLEMEDWEIAPGTIRTPSDEPDSMLHTSS